MAALEAVILYVQLTLGIANPTSTDIQRASTQMGYSSPTTTSVSYVTSSVNKAATSTTGWDTSEGN